MLISLDAFFRFLTPPFTHLASRQKKTDNDFVTKAIAFQTLSIIRSTPSILQCLSRLLSQSPKNSVQAVSSNDPVEIITDSQVNNARKLAQPHQTKQAPLASFARIHANVGCLGVMDRVANRFPRSLVSFELESTPHCSVARLSRIPFYAHPMIAGDFRRQYQADTLPADKAPIESRLRFAPNHDSLDPDFRQQELISGAAERWPTSQDRLNDKVTASKNGPQALNHGIRDKRATEQNPRKNNCYEEGNVDQCVAKRRMPNCDH